MPDFFRLKHVAAAHPTQTILDGIDLGQVVQEVEAHYQLVQVSGHEGGSDLCTGFGGAG